MEIKVFGKKCQRSEFSNIEPHFNWVNHDLFNKYEYKRIINKKMEYITVQPIEAKLVIMDQNFKLMGKYDLKGDIDGFSSLLVNFDLISGISSNKRADFLAGKTVKSIFYLQFQSKQSRTYSWNDRIDLQISGGRSHSFIFDIVKE